ncbi:MAG: metal ABC transporter ATP-binding protein [Dehalococcoidia bacterium]
MATVDANQRDTGTGDFRPAIEVRDVWAGYDGRAALEGVTLAIEEGCLAGLVGPNGSGKSTLLRVVLGLHRPWRGEVRLFGQKTDRIRRLLGYMPQVELVDWAFPVSVFDVVMMGRYGRLGLLRRPSRPDREVVWRCLEQVGMADLAHRQIGELSGGQQRRVLIARTLAQEPRVLLLDEPFTGLDASAQHDLLDLLNEVRAAGKTLLVATHDLSCVAAAFDHAACLNRKIIAFGRPQAIFTEEILNATFQTHLLLVNVEGKTYVSYQ